MSEELRLGSRLGHFQLLWELGRGGMASVWTAREISQRTGKQRLVAVKAMLPKLAQRPDFRSMFLDEGQLVRSIEHPSVVRVYEVEEDHGVLYLAMEWVEGDTLYALIKGAKQRRAIPPEDAVRIIADTAAGLHVAHELRGWDGELRGVVHCDVSPHNILLGLDGHAKVVDFGVAHAATYADNSGAERVAGKAGYMSPEQALGEPIDRRSDLFSLGIVLYELTTGQRLFKGRDRAHTMHLVHVAEIPKPSTIHPDYPPALEQIVEKALERKREQRYQTAEEFSQALEQFLVDSRIMVSRASVGQLLKRVLGEQIQQRRDNIRQALKALYEGNAEGLTGHVPGLPAAELSLPSLSLPGASLTGTGSHTAVSAVGTNGAAVADVRPSSRSNVARVAVPAVLVAAAGMGAYWLLQPKPVSVTHISVGPPPTAAAAPQPVTSSAADRDAATGTHNADAGRTSTAAVPAPVTPAAPKPPAADAGVAPAPPPASAATAAPPPAPAPVRKPPEDGVDFSNPYR